MFRQASNLCKGFLEDAKLAYANKTKSLSLPRNLVLWTFGELLIVFSTKLNLLYLLCSMAQRYCVLHLIKQNCLIKTLLRTLILMTLVSLYLVFASRTNLKLRNISVTTKMDKKIMMNLNSSKTSGPGCIPVVVLKNYEPELSYIRSLREVVGRSRGWSLYFKNVGERSTAKNYRLASLLSLLNKVFEKLVNNRIADHIEKCCLFSGFQHGFRAS